MAGDKVYSFPVEGYIYEGMSTWHADDDGEYYGCQITLFEAPDDAIEIAYIEGAPESITTGMYYIRDGKMTRERYEVYHTLVDESAPLWKKDVAEMMKLYVADNPSAHKGAKFAKFRWLDIDTDNNDELWIRSADDKHGAIFNRINGKWGLIATEGSGHKVEFRFDYSGNNSPGYLMVTRYVIVRWCIGLPSTRFMASWMVAHWMVRQSISRQDRSGWMRCQRIVISHSGGRTLMNNKRENIWIGKSYLIRYVRVADALPSASSCCVSSSPCLMMTTIRRTTTRLPPKPNRWRRRTV